MKVQISKREQEVLSLISHEYSTKEIADILFISYETAHSHRKNLLRKLGARNSAGLIRKAFEQRMLSLSHPSPVLEYSLPHTFSNPPFVPCSKAQLPF